MIMMTDNDGRKEVVIKGHISVQNRDNAEFVPRMGNDLRTEGKASKEALRFRNWSLFGLRPSSRIYSRN
jgi:hypothetical protein